MTTTYLPEVRIETIRPHGNNPRKDVGDIADLAASIQAVGLLEPLVLAPMNGSEHRLIAGHRRLAAAKEAGLATVPALLREDLDTPPKQLEAMLVENTQRVDLTPVEEGQAYAQLIAFPGYTAAKAAKATGRSVKTVKARLAIAELPQATLDKMLDGQISLADAQILAEFAGTKHFTRLSKSIGNTNFKYDVQRVRDDIKIGQRVEQLREYFTAKGWTEAPERPGGAINAVASSWQSGSATTKKLDALTGDHVLVVTETNWGGLSWSIYRKPTEDEIKAAQRTTGRLRDDSEWEAKNKARTERLEQLATAREVRSQFLTGRLTKLVLKPDERTTLLRLIVGHALTDWDYNDDDLELAGIPIPEDGDRIATTWLPDANENQLWKALAVLALDLGQNGNTWTDTSHVTPIRAAIALGYEPTDVERALLAAQEPTDA